MAWVATGAVDAAGASDRAVGEAAGAAVPAGCSGVVIVAAGDEATAGASVATTPGAGDAG